jgi:hypothetical protein
MVDIVREFLAAHQMMRRHFALFRAGQLHFDDVQKLVGDSEEAVLFRLKEKCHAFFRRDEAGERLDAPHEALFDLAVGSLFHEAMKFRENLYQQEVYAPKVELLRNQAGHEAAELFQEFEKILSASSLRIEETLEETEALLAQTRAQLRLLLVAHRRNGLIARYLLSEKELVEEVFPEGLDALFAEVHGAAGQGYVEAARSFLESTFFDEGLEALAEAGRRAADPRELDRLTAYGRGMQAFLVGHYAATLEELARWVDAAPDEREASAAALALAAVARIPQLVDASERERAESAAALAKRIEAAAVDGGSA